MHDVSSDLGRPVAAAGAIEAECGGAIELSRGDLDLAGAGQVRTEAVGYPFQAIRAMRLLQLVTSHQRSTAGVVGRR